MEPTCDRPVRGQKNDREGEAASLLRHPWRFSVRELLCMRGVYSGKLTHMGLNGQCVSKLFDRYGITLALP
jgi:hypothetical protein